MALPTICCCRVTAGLLDEGVLLPPQRAAWTIRFRSSPRRGSAQGVPPCGEPVGARVRQRAVQAQPRDAAVGVDVEPDMRHRTLAMGAGEETMDGVRLEG